MNDPLRSVDILFAEDSEEDADMTLRTLRKSGIANQIQWVRDGVEALDYLLARGAYADRPPGNPRFVLLDLKMPRLDGLEVLARMKETPELRVIPVVMMTSSREEGDKLRSYSLGVSSYVVKPVDFPQFSETVRQVGMYWMLANEVPRM